MDWSNERYVRVYTRDTVDRLALPWEARALFTEILRKVDRAGLLDLGKHGVKGLAVAVGMPIKVVGAALPALLEDGCVVERGSCLFLPNFLDAQEAKQTDAQRARESRANRRDRARGDVTEPDGDVTIRDATVTPGHTESQPVTAGHSVLCQTSLATPPEGEGATVRAHAPKPPRKSRRSPRPETRCPADGASEVEVVAWAREHTIDASHPSFRRFLQWHRDEDKPRRNWCTTWTSWIERDAVRPASSPNARKGDVRAIAQADVSPDIGMQVFA